MSNIEIQFKSATPVKIDYSTNARLKKIKNTASSVLYFGCSSVFVPVITIPLQGIR
jgi:hypothetical protein